MKNYQSYRVQKEKRGGQIMKINLINRYLALKNVQFKID